MAQNNNYYFNEQTPFQDNWTMNQGPDLGFEMNQGSHLNESGHFDIYSTPIVPNVDNLLSPIMFPVQTQDFMMQQPNAFNQNGQFYEDRTGSIFLAEQSQSQVGLPHGIYNGDYPALSFAPVSDNQPYWPAVQYQGVLNPQYGSLLAVASQSDQVAQTMDSLFTLPEWGHGSMPDIGQVALQASPFSLSSSSMNPVPIGEMHQMTSQPLVAAGPSMPHRKSSVATIAESENSDADQMTGKNIRLMKRVASAPNPVSAAGKKEKKSRRRFEKYFPNNDAAQKGVQAVPVTSGTMLSLIAAREVVGKPTPTRRVKQARNHQPQQPQLYRQDPVAPVAPVALIDQVSPIVLVSPVVPVAPTPKVSIQRPKVILRPRQPVPEPAANNTIPQAEQITYGQDFHVSFTVPASVAHSQSSHAPVASNTIPQAESSTNDQAFQGSITAPAPVTHSQPADARLQTNTPAIVLTQQVHANPVLNPSDPNCDPPPLVAHVNYYDGLDSDFENNEFVRMANSMEM